MISFADFRTKYNGKGIDFDGYYGDQCVDEINQYLVDVLGITNPIVILPGNTAFDIYQNYHGTQFTKIDNSPTNVPHEGDIIFFKPNIPGQTGSAGHVALFISGDVNSFRSLDQNYPTGTLVHEQNHTYDAVAGWLHPNTSPVSPGTTQGGLPPNYDEIIGKATKWDTMNAAGYSDLATIQKTIDSLTDARDNNQKAYQEELTKNTDLTNQIKELTDANTGLKSNISQIQKQNTDLLITLKEHNTTDSTAIDEGLKAEQENTKLHSELNKIAAGIGAKESTSTSILEVYTELESQVAAGQKTQKDQLSRFEKFLQIFIDKFIKKK